MLKGIIIGFIMGFILGGITLAYAYQLTVLVSSNGTEWGSAGNPVYIQ